MSLWQLRPTLETMFTLFVRRTIDSPPHPLPPKISRSFPKDKNDKFNANEREVGVCVSRRRVKRNLIKPNGETVFAGGNVF